jgi:cation diffusion facilitator CzcD-associated flavoprotein CzcO
VATLRSVLSPELVANVARWRNILLGMSVFQLCRRLPGLARALILQRTRRALGPEYDVESHFSPHYPPWDQRLCIAPDGDLFEVLRSGQASVVTDGIVAFTETGLSLASGQQLPADLVVTATGLELQLMSNLEITVDGSRIDAAQSISYRGVMFSGIPNLASCFGYTNASWTLRSELSARFVCRLLQYMAHNGYQQCRPRHPGDGDESQPLVDFSSGYVKRGVHRFPRQGSRAPWRMRQNYLWDRLDSGWRVFSDGSLEFSSLREPRAFRRAAQEGRLV